MIRAEFPQHERHERDNADEDRIHRQSVCPSALRPLVDAEHQATDRDSGEDRTLDVEAPGVFPRVRHSDVGHDPRREDHHEGKNEE